MTWLSPYSSIMDGDITPKLWEHRTAKVEPKKSALVIAELAKATVGAVVADEHKVARAALVGLATESLRLIADLDNRAFDRVRVQLPDLELAASAELPKEVVPA